MHRSCSVEWKIYILDKEKKKMAGEDEIDTSIFYHLCGKIMDEVMDASSDLNDFTVPLSKTKHHNSKGKKVQGTTVSEPSHLSK